MQNKNFIKKFDKKDIDKIMKIWLETNINTHTFIDKTYFENNYEDVKDSILNANIYVYEENGKIVAFIGLIGNYIAGLFVKDDMQNKGIGKMLIDVCKERYDNLILNVYEKNIRAIKFYKNNDFIITDEDIDKNTKEKEYLMIWKK